MSKKNGMQPGFMPAVLALAERLASGEIDERTYSNEFERLFDTMKKRAA